MSEPFPMQVTAAPIVTELAAIPVAGHDSMLLNLSGAHGPFFTRNLVILKDNAGRTGIGEVPGARPSAGPSKTPNRWCWGTRSVPTTVSSTPCARPLRRAMRRVVDSRPSTCARPFTPSRALEAALLDLLGQFLGVPVAALLGEGQQRRQVSDARLFVLCRRPQQDQPALPAGARRSQRLVPPASREKP